QRRGLREAKIDNRDASIASETPGRLRIVPIYARGAPAPRGQTAHQPGKFETADDSRLAYKYKIIQYLFVLSRGLQLLALYASIFLSAVFWPRARGAQKLRLPLPSQRSIFFR